MESILYLSINNCRKFLTRLLMIILSVCALTFSGNAQLNEINIDPNLTSGIVQEMDSLHDEAIVQYKILDLDLEMANLIFKDLSKYEGSITGFGQAVIDQKIIVSFKAPFTPNHILSILDRVNIKGYYEVSGENIYYFKDGNSFFLH